MIHLHHDDALTVMGSMPDGCIDAIITDPPYGTTALPWDQTIDYAAFWREAERVTKDTAIIAVFCAQPMMTDLINSNRKAFRYDLVWHKTCPVGFLDAKKRPLRAHENIAIFCRRWRGKSNAGLSTYNPQFWFSTPYNHRARAGDRCTHYGVVGDRDRRSDDGRRYPISVLTYANRVGAKSPHPTAKPVELLRWLVSTYTNDAELVLDPFMGAGSTGVAATELGRGFIGVELNERYFATAQERIDVAFVGGHHGETHSKATPLC